MSKLSFVSTNFAMDFLFKSGLPPLVSNFELKKILNCEHNAFVLTVIKLFLAGFQAPPKFLHVQFQY